MAEENKMVLQFKVVDRGKWAYILWPWTTPEEFVYMAAQLGTFYKLHMPTKLSQACWLEFEAQEGTHGEYQRNLFFGHTQWGAHIYRKFDARGSHYLTQHGLDGIPQAIWDAAYEYRPGKPMGDVQIKFRVAPRDGGLFELTFYEWIEHFQSGRNCHIREMAITVKRR